MSDESKMSTWRAVARARQSRLTAGLRRQLQRSVRRHNALHSVPQPPSLSERTHFRCNPTRTLNRTLTFARCALRNANRLVRVLPLLELFPVSSQCLTERLLAFACLLVSCRVVSCLVLYCIVFRDIRGHCTRVLASSYEVHFWGPASVTIGDARAAGSSCAEIAATCRCRVSERDRVESSLRHVVRAQRRQRLRGEPAGQLAFFVADDEQSLAGQISTAAALVLCLSSV